MNDTEIEKWASKDEMAALILGILVGLLGLIGMFGFIYLMLFGLLGRLRHITYGSILK